MSILKNYDVLLLDLWGVIYDGYDLYPNVIQTLQKLKKLGKEIIFLSNVPRRRHTVQEMLGKFTIDDSLYSKLITSGEFIHELLCEKKQFGTKYFYIGSPDSEEVVLNLKDYQKVTHAKDADFGIITSILGYQEESMKLAMEAMKYKLPLLCTNPDKSSIKKDGKMTYCTGIIADKYESLGGKVIYFGKPYKPIYEHILQKINNKKKVLAIGDSMENDIKGANNMNLDSVLVCSGIHRHDLEIEIGGMPSTKNLLKLYEKYSVKPTFVISLLKDIIQQ